MTTTAAVRDAWKVQVLQHVSVRAISEAILDYEPTFESATELVKLRHNAELNALAVIVRKSTKARRTNQIEETFDVTIRAYRRNKPDGSTQKQILTDLETIDAVAVAALGKTWGGLVDYWRTTESLPTLEQTLIDNAPTWIGSVTYQGFKIS
jgi:hypothetical protein